MSDRRSTPPDPVNEEVRSHAPGTPERDALAARLDDLADQVIDAPCVIDGQDVTTGDTFELRAPHDHALHLGDAHAAGVDQVQAAIDAAQAAKHDWAAMDWRDRAAIFLRAADLLSGPWRATLNAATMLHQSKNVQQAEIDAAVELIDFWRFNCHLYSQILEDQPISTPGVWNYLEARPLDGFVLAITPFNFTAIAGNLPTAPALCGNTVVWKPSEKQAYSAHFLMRLLQAAGLPDGVINLIHGDGALAAGVAMEHPDFAGLHFTGSRDVLTSLWRDVGNRIDTYRNFPRVVGESGGKDFVIAHPSAEVAPLVTALVRGAFEYQGQKCSAASRAYIPASLWPDVRDGLIETTADLTMGDVRDFSVFMGAVIEERAFRRHRDALEAAANDPDCEVLVGGGTDDGEGWFVEPSIVQVTDPRHDLMERELFGPILAVYVYEDDDWSEALDLVDTTSPYALTGAVFSTDRQAAVDARERLRQAAGNFYVNDKPTGSIVGQQPFGGARMSGTNDKAGSALNLLRWISMRSIKETSVPPTDVRYPHMG
jgi:1-pyrroline-5-carboxylate dehydrogenase